MPISSVIQRLWVLIASNPIQSLSNLFPFRIQVHPRELSSTSLSASSFSSFSLTSSLMFSYPSSIFFFISLLSIWVEPFVPLEFLKWNDLLQLPSSINSSSFKLYPPLLHSFFFPHPNSKVIQRKVMEKKHGFHFQLFRLSISFHFRSKALLHLLACCSIFLLLFLNILSLPLKSVYQKEE